MMLLIITKDQVEELPLIESMKMKNEERLKNANFYTEIQYYNYETFYKNEI